MTTSKLAQHVTELCAAFGVHLLVRPEMRPDEAAAGTLRADNDLPVAQRRCIRIVPVIDESTYAVALHELGHCLSPMGSVNTTEGSRTMRETNRVSTLRDVRLQLEEEHAAWAWAQSYALEWTPLMQYVQDIALASYIEVARRLGAIK